MNRDNNTYLKIMVSPNGTRPLDLHLYENDFIRLNSISPPLYSMFFVNYMRYNTKNFLISTSNIMYTNNNGKLVACVDTISDPILCGLLKTYFNHHSKLFNNILCYKTTDNDYYTLGDLFFKFFEKIGNDS